MVEMSSTRRITRSSVKKVACQQENANIEEPAQPTSAKTRLLKCSPVLKSETADVYEFEADPNEPKAFKKKKQRNRKPRPAVPHTRAKRVAASTPPRRVATRSTSATATSKTAIENHKNPVLKATDDPETASCTPRKQPRVQVSSDSLKESTDLRCPSGNSTLLKPGSGEVDTAEEETRPPVDDILERLHTSFEGPGVYSDIENHSISEIDLSCNAASVISSQSIHTQLPEPSCGFAVGQMKAQSTPLRPMADKNKSLRIPFSPINGDRPVSRPAAKQNLCGYGKTARLDREDLRKLCAVKETVRPKHAEKNTSLLVDCAAEAEGIQSPVKAPNEDVPLECPLSPNVHFSKPARRSYTSRPKAQRQIFHEEDSESEDETRVVKRKKKALKKKEKAKDAQYDQWISQMKDHFDDVENYTLVCD